MKIWMVLTAAACLTAAPAVAQYQTPQYNQNGQYNQNQQSNDHDRDNQYNQNHQYDQNQNPNPRARGEENAQERASGINDSVNIVNGPTIQNLTPTSAVLVWQTNKEAASRVRYGTNPENPGEHAYEAGGTRDHHVELNNLRPGMTYHYEIETRGGKDRFKGSFRTPRG
jgi:Purple acid Phosphatase, N-terminal domain